MDVKWRKINDVHLRDPFIIKDGDGGYIMTGSSTKITIYDSDGVYYYHSNDLENWIGPYLILSKKQLLLLTQQRLEPVMMTTLTSIIAFLPLIISGNTTGKEILYPLAVVIAFGLLTTTILNMLITPIIYHHFHSKR